MLDTVSQLNLAVDTYTPQMLHSIAVHIPIVFALVGLPIAMVALVRLHKGRGWLYGAIVTYAIASLAGFLAVLTGDAAQDVLPGSLAPEVWDQLLLHEMAARFVWYFSLATLGCLAITAAFQRPWLSRSTGLASVACSIATLGAVVIAGHQGNTLVYRYGVGAPALMVVTHQAKATAMPGAILPQQPTGHAPMNVAGNISYHHHIAPILGASCASCHNGIDGDAGLDLTSYAGVLAGGDQSGPAIIPNDAENSPLLQYILGELEPRMPKGEHPLGEEDADLIRTWIAEGAREGESLQTAEDVPLQSEDAVKTSLLEYTVDAQYAKWLENNDASLTETIAARRNLRYAALSGEAARQGKVEIQQGPPTARFGLWGVEGPIRLQQALRTTYLPPTPRLPEVSPGESPIDAFVEQTWRDAGIEPAEDLCDDEAFLRRVYFDLIGVPAQSGEAQAFLADTAPDKREVLIDTLLARDRDYADRWVPYWEDLLVSAPVLTDNRRANLFGFGGYFRDWIFDSFRQNKPADIMMMELLDKRMPDFQPRYAFTRSTEVAYQAAADVSQVFMGISLRCAQCHNHKDIPDWTQTKLMGMASYLYHEDVELLRCDKSTGITVSPAFIMPLPGAGSVPMKMGRPKRAEFVQHLVDPNNTLFARTIVNRVWHRFMGIGLSEPLDDYRAEYPSNQEALWAWLSNDFVVNGYDLKRLVRQILTSKTYQRPYRAEWVDPTDRAYPQPPRYFRSPALRRLTAEQYIDSVNATLGNHWRRIARAYNMPIISPLALAFGRTARDQVITRRSEEPSTGQAFELINGEQLHDLVYNSKWITAQGSRLENPAQRTANITHAYWAILNRAPTTVEMETAGTYLAALDTTQDAPPYTRLLGDIYWALYTSPEFLYLR
jgi:uncharacterized membrane protein